MELATTSPLPNGEPLQLQCHDSWTMLTKMASPLDIYRLVIPSCNLSCRSLIATWRKGSFSASKCSFRERGAPPGAGEQTEAVRFTHGHAVRAVPRPRHHLDVSAR